MRTFGSNAANPAIMAAWVRDACEMSTTSSTGDARQRGNVRGRCFPGRTQPAVEKAHHAFDHRHVGRSCAVQQQRNDAVLADQERVQVAARPTGGQGVVAGVDEVGPHLVTGYRHAPSGQSGHQSGCHRGFSVARCRRGDDDAGEVGGYHSMPRWPFWPASIGCLTLVMSVTRSAMSISRGSALRPVMTTC